MTAQDERRARRIKLSVRGLLGATLLVAVLVGVGESKSTHVGAGRIDARPGSTELTSGWALRSANGEADTGAAISRVRYSTSGWHPVTLPATVLAGLVADNVYPNIYYAKNLQSVPDLTGQNWWYRGEFTAPAGSPGQQYWLELNGISYRAQIWLNGTQLDRAAVGTLVSHAYNVTSVINAGSSNAIAILVTPPAHGCKDLSICTVDWNPEAPDMNAGISGKALLVTTGSVAVSDPYVKTKLPLPATNSADLTVYVDALNATNTPTVTTIDATIAKAGHPPISVSQTVTLNANERREIVFQPGQYPSLRLRAPALWWPYQFGRPELYGLTVSAQTEGTESDTKSIQFGIRQFSDYRTTVHGTSFVGYKVNGRRIFIRGGGYMWDLLQRWNTRTNAATVAYVKDMGLNTIRLEGTLGNDEVYALADRAGVLIMPGFPCCSAWESDSTWTAEQQQVANASLNSQMRALRAHPSAFVWAFGSDRPPTAAHLAMYRSTANALHWQNPTLDNVATYSNANAGMKMDGPYTWEPPVLWWDTKRSGSAFGTTAEEGAESPPPLESLRKFIGPNSIWPIDSVWNYHSGKSGSVFDNVDSYTRALNSRYGGTMDAAAFSKESELQNYETTRAFFEAWNSHEFKQSFGTIFWMLNNGWPSLRWNLYDYFLKPAGSYFGAKKANEPMHIAYDYLTRKVYVVNSTLRARSNLTVTASIYDTPSLAVRATRKAPVIAAANASTEIVTIPAVRRLSPTYLIRLKLTSSTGAAVSNNLYWYSTTPDALSKQHNWFMTGVKIYANLKGLNRLQSNNRLTVSVTRQARLGQERVRVALHNRSTANIAFFVRPEVTAGQDGNEVLPINYSDNYVTLWPGESATINATYATTDLGGRPPYLRVRGYNLPTRSIPVP